VSTMQQSTWYVRSKFWFIVCICRIDGTSINSNPQRLSTPIGTFLSLDDGACSHTHVKPGGSIIRALSWYVAFLRR